MIVKSMVITIPLVEFDMTFMNEGIKIENNEGIAYIG